jgi:hypothetical protein
MSEPLTVSDPPVPSAEPGGRPGRWGSALRDNAFPVGLFVVVDLAILLSVRLLPASQRSEFSWWHGDSGIYLWIVNNGYSLNRCGAGYPPGSWCGNTGWQPLYPWLIKTFTVAGANETAAAVVLSQVCTLAVFVLLWQIIGPVRHRMVVMLTAAVFPGIIYYFTLFPISLLILLALVLFRLLGAQRYRWALIPAFLIPLSYSSAVVVILVLGLWLVAFRRFQGWRPVALVLGASAVGYIVFLAVLKITVGTWRAEYLVQAKYGNGLHNPVKTLFTLTAPAPGRFFGSGDIVALQTQLVLLIMIVLTYVVYDNRARLTSIDQLVVCWTYVFWFTPLVVGLGISSYRSNALLLPAVVLFRYMNRALLFPLIVLSAPVAYLLAVPVLTGKLV